MLRTNLDVKVTAVGSQDLSGAWGTVPAVRPPSLHTASPSPQGSRAPDWLRAPGAVPVPGAGAVSDLLRGGGSLKKEPSTGHFYLCDSAPALSPLLTSDFLAIKMGTGMGA